MIVFNIWFQSAARSASLCTGTRSFFDSAAGSGGDAGVSWNTRDVMLSGRTNAVREGAHTRAAPPASSLNIARRTHDEDAARRKRYVT